MSKHLAHPVAGPLQFGIESVVGPHDPEQRLVVYTVEPGSVTEQALPLLRRLGCGGVRQRRRGTAMTAPRSSSR
ncbi:hypothetical protein GCM10025868_15980 [Angustibacter aerolatus]|uniref:MmyB-like transcription regulator ligand binding domain-containing protein n=1 Tax=Angustibacter aerolatus TaxID=1162965 RepID=A0ABQ6JDU4_9ACTN|nr:hypothetical protein GCM10025868_15980 [Angustibacter aerolatus]